MKIKYRVNWRSGMKLTDTVFKASDEFFLSQLNSQNSMMIHGGYGLFSEADIRAKIDDTLFSAVELVCRGITASGKFINIDYDRDRANRNIFQNVEITSGYEPFIVYIDASSSEPAIIEDGEMQYCDIDYRLILKPEAEMYFNPDALPIARFSFDTAWTQDKTFIPPCLYLKSNGELLRQCGRYLILMQDFIGKLKKRVDSEQGDLIIAVLPQLISIAVELDKEKEAVSPKHFLTLIQKGLQMLAFIGELDSAISVPEQDAFYKYLRTSFQPTAIYELIEEGIRLTQLMFDHIFDNLTERQIIEMPPVPQPMPDPRKLRDKGQLGDRLKRR